MAFCSPPSEARKESPLGPSRRPRPLIEIGEGQDSLYKEPSAGYSTGELGNRIRR